MSITIRSRKQIDREVERRYEKINRMYIETGKINTRSYTTLIENLIRWKSVQYHGLSVYVSITGDRSLDGVRKKIRL